MDSTDKFFQDKLKEEKATVYARCLKLFENNEELKDLFCFNQMTNSVEFSRAPLWTPDTKPNTDLEDFDLTAARSFLTRRYNFSPTKDNIFDSICDVARAKSYHPIKDYIIKLRWDGLRRLDDWLHCVCGVPDNKYTQAVSRKMFTAAVARAFDPGVKFDCLVILEGKQGTKKSMLIEEMAIFPKYYTTVNFSHTDKEIVEITSGKWIIEVEEMHGFRKQEVERTRALLSRKTDRTRLAYGRLAKDFPRRSILVGTLNPIGENKYLADEAGNRRYWPVVCSDKIDIDLFREIRDQLYAEAYLRWKEGEKLFLDNEEVEGMAIKEQEARRTIDPWKEIVEEWLEVERKKFKKKTTILEIMRGPLNIQAERINSVVTARVGRILNRTKWIKEGGFYLAPETAEEMAQHKIDFNPNDEF